MPTVDLSMNGNGMGDLSIVGSPTPRAESRGAVTARNQSAKRITLNKSMNNVRAVSVYFIHLNNITQSCFKLIFCSFKMDII